MDLNGLMKLLALRQDDPQLSRVRRAHFNARFGYGEMSHRRAHQVVLTRLESREVELSPLPGGQRDPLGRQANAFQGAEGSGQRHPLRVDHHAFQILRLW